MSFCIKPNKILITTLLPVQIWYRKIQKFQKNILIEKSHLKKVNSFKRHKIVTKFLFSTDKKFKFKNAVIHKFLK